MHINREVFPKPAGEIDFQLPDINSFAADNGIQTYFVRKTKLPIIQLNLLIEAGSKYDPADKCGLANLLSHTIDEGAGKYTSLQISDILDSMGTIFNIRTSRDYIIFSMLSLTEHFEASLELLATIVAEPHFKEQDFEREKRKILVRLLQQKDNADEIANNLFTSIVYGADNPYRTPLAGTQGMVAGISRNDVITHYTNFIKPMDAVITSAGNIETETLRNLINKHLNFTAPKGSDLELDYPMAFRKQRIYVANKEKAVQTEIRVGHKIESNFDNLYFEKLIMNTILGGQFSSRINLNLREKHGFTYGAHSMLNYFKDSGYFAVSTSVNNENTGAALDEILSELDDIRVRIEQDEVDFAKSSLIKRFPGRFETYNQIAGNLNYKVIMNLPDSYFNTYIDKVRSAERKKILKAANDLIFAESTQVVLVGKKDEIVRSLRQQNFFDVIELDTEGNEIK